MLDEHFLARQANVYFFFDERPFFRRSQRRHEILERLGMLRRVIEPGQEIERFVVTQVATMVKTTSDCRQIRRAGLYVVGAILEDLSSLILRQIPPCGLF